jgi:hypothetical protein
MSAGSGAPERWSAQTRTSDVVRLEIPADAHRDRSFEIFCRLVTAAPSARRDATHSLRLRVDGALEWARTVPVQADGADSLDLRLRRTVPAGRALRLVAHGEWRGASRVSLSISADEE